MVSSVVVFVLLDLVKVLVYRYWCFEFTVRLWPTKARRDELSMRTVQSDLDNRVRERFSLLRRGMVMAAAVNSWKSFKTID